MREESYLRCIKMTLKFAQYCNVANVVLISIWAADNLFRQEHLICMQGGQSCGLGLHPPSFYFPCKYRSASGRGSYSLQEDKVRTLKQMEDLLNSLLGVWMHFILISLLDRNVFFTSDKEPGKQWPGCVSSGRPGPGWLSTTRLFSQINQEASQCQGGWGFTISSSEVSWSRSVTWSWTEVFSRKVSPPLSLSFLRFFELPWLFWSPALSQREARTVQAAE